MEAGSGAPAEALLAALRRAWRNAEGRRVAGSGAIAPAGHVARAVGTLLVGAATHDLRWAARGAAAGCAPGVARMVDVALARQVLEALPLPADPVAIHATARSEARPELELGLGGPRPHVPPPSWWCREPAWTPRVVVDATRPGRESPPPTPVTALWPPVPEAPDRPAALRPEPARRTRIASDALEPQALRILEAELQLGEWSMMPRSRPTPPMGGAR